MKLYTVRPWSLTKGNSEESWKYMSFFRTGFQAIQHKPIFSNKLFCIQKVLCYTFTFLLWSVRLIHSPATLYNASRLHFRFQKKLQTQCFFQILILIPFLFKGPSQFWNFKPVTPQSGLHTVKLRKSRK